MWVILVCTYIQRQCLPVVPSKPLEVTRNSADGLISVSTFMVLVLLLLEAALWTAVHKQLCSIRAEHEVFTQTFVSVIIIVCVCGR